MEAGGDDAGMHVVIFPWLAFGHLLPGLELARRLASRGHRVSFVSTPRNLARLPPVAPPAMAALVDLVALPMPAVEGLPDGVESTNDVPYNKFELHRHAFDGLAAPFAAFLDAACADGSRRPDWVVVDCFHYWAAAAAAQRKLPCGMLVLSAAGHVVAREQGRRAAAAPRFEAETMNKLLRASNGASGVSAYQRVVLTQQSCNLVAVRSCPELDEEAFHVPTSYGGKPVVPFGLLPPSHDGGRPAGKDDAAILSWLDAQPVESVVYVAMGSEAPLDIEQVHELALGLELAGTRFHWALRRPRGGDPDAAADDVLLPPGFLERTRGRGLVATAWVPQTRVLAHAAVSAFLTHCGWSSTVEGLLFGRPLIMLPIYADQGTNARMMEARQVGLQVPRNEDDGSFDRHGVATVVRAVAVEQGGSRKVFVANAKKLQAIVADRECQERCVRVYSATKVLLSTPSILL